MQRRSLEYVIVEMFEMRMFQVQQMIGVADILENAVIPEVGYFEFLQEECL